MIKKARRRAGILGEWRSYFILFSLFLFGAVLMGRLVFVQILDHGFYLALARGQQNVSSVETGERGEIFATDKNGTLYLLATNQRTPYVFATPIEVQEKEDTASRLSGILEMPEEEILEQLEREDTLHAVLKQEITEEQRAVLVEAGLPGIYAGEKQKRHYPHGAFASHLLGFVNDEGRGQYGVEEYYDEELRGKEGVETFVRNPAGYLFSLFQDTSRDGSDLVLTVDYNIQSVAESVLQETAERLNAAGGTVLVMEPSSGNVLALANLPEFDPNRFSAVEDLSVFQNPAVQQVLEPGSVLKPVTMSSALDTGAVTPDTTYQDTGVANVGGHSIRNYENDVWGESTMTEVLMYSINTGAVFAQSQLGNRPFVEYLEKFGIFSPTGIDLAGEVFSENKEFKKGYAINYATASFGQGVEMTLLQLVRSYMPFARDGTLTQPRVGNLLIPPHGSPEPVKQTQEPRRVLAPKTASQITGMLVKVTEGGYGRRAQLPGYFVAGKTGTAQVPWSVLGVSRSGYSDETVQSFVGYVPAFEPRAVVLVSLRSPSAPTAGASVTLAFRELAQYIVNYYEIPPSQEGG